MATYTQFSKDRQKLAEMSDKQLKETRQNLIGLQRESTNEGKLRSVATLLEWCDEEIARRTLPAN